MFLPFHHKKTEDEVSLAEQTVKQPTKAKKKKIVRTVSSQVVSLSESVRFEPPGITSPETSAVTKHSRIGVSAIRRLYSSAISSRSLSSISSPGSRSRSYVI